MFPLKIGKKRYQNKLPNSGFCSSHYFTWETCIFRRIYSRKQHYRVVRLLVKANACKNLYQYRLKLDIGIMCFTISFIEKDVQLITPIIIVNWSVWLLCTVKVAPKFISFSLLRLCYFSLLYGILSLSWPPPPLPYFLSLKHSNVLLWHLIWTANMEPTTGIGVSKNVVFNFCIRPPIWTISVVCIHWVQRRLCKQTAGEKGS